MTDFWRTILKSFGMAAVTATALDSAGTAGAPAEEAPEAEPAADAGAVNAPGADVMVERAPKGDDLGSKLDRVIEMLAALHHEEKEDGHKLSDESDLDKAIVKLTATERSGTFPTAQPRRHGPPTGRGAPDASNLSWPPRQP